MQRVTRPALFGDTETELLVWSCKCACLNRHCYSQALQAIHDKGMIHGDAKPDNFRVSMKADGTDLKLTLIDMGSAAPAGTGKLQPSACSLAGAVIQSADAGIITHSS